MNFFVVPMWKWTLELMKRRNQKVEYTEYCRVEHKWYYYRRDEGILEDFLHLGRFNKVTTKVSRKKILNQKI